MFFFFFNDTATTEIYTLSLHDALPIYQLVLPASAALQGLDRRVPVERTAHAARLGLPAQRGARRLLRQIGRDTSELQSRQYLVCRLLLEKKKNTILNSTILRINYISAK